MTERVLAHPRITVVRDEVTSIPSPGIIATGPLTSDALAAAIRARLGVESLAFYDAIAPIVARDSIDDAVVFRASRYGKETMPDADAEGAYLNCPISREEYDAFLDALVVADQYHGHEFDEVPYFEGCMPVEVMAQRGRETLRFGPMKPVGLRDPRTGREAWAVVQLRQEDRAGQMWNLVGFQTRLRIPEQQRVFRMIPGLANAEFLRFGSIHRNSYINSPGALTAHLSLRDDPLALFAGQLTGVEGYTESTATGLLAAINLSRMLARRGAGDPAADDDARRALPLHARGRPPTLPADERELRIDRGTGRTSRRTEKGRARTSASRTWRSPTARWRIWKRGGRST